MDSFILILTNSLVPILIAVVTSSGFWAYLTHLENKKKKKDEMTDARTQMLIGLGHDRIISLGMTYIERGYITNEEYENLYEYLYKPYEKCGGNGSAKRIMEEVRKLPIQTR